MPDLDELIRRLEDIESLLVRSKAAPQPRIDMPALLEEVRTAVAAGQHRTDSRLDEVWLAVAELSERLGVEPPAFPSAPDDDGDGEAGGDGDGEAGGAGDGPAGAATRPGTELAHRLVTLQDAVAELTRVMPRTSGPAAGVPGYLAESLSKIDQRLIAVERMGREQFELDQRLSAIEQTLATLIRPFEELSPRLRHVGEIVDWLGRIEERLHAVSIQLAPLVLEGQGRRQPPPALPPAAAGEEPATEVQPDPAAGPVPPGPVPADAAQLGQLIAQLEARLGREQPGPADVGAVLDKLAVIEARLVEPAADRGGEATPPAAAGPDQHLVAVEDAVARVEAQLAAVAAQLRAAPAPQTRTPLQVSGPVPVEFGAPGAEPGPAEPDGGDEADAPRSRRRGPGRRSGAGRGRRLRAAARRDVVGGAGRTDPSRHADAGAGAGLGPEAPAPGDRPAGSAGEPGSAPAASTPVEGIQSLGAPSASPDGADSPDSVAAALDMLAKRLDFLAVQVATEQERSREADLDAAAALLDLLALLDDMAAATGKGRRGEESLDQRLRRLGDEVRGAIAAEAAALRDTILEGVAEEGQASRATTANTAAALAALARETAGSKAGIERVAEVVDRQHGTVAALVESLGLRDERVAAALALLHAQLAGGQLTEGLAGDLAAVRQALTDAAARAETADDALELIRGSVNDLAAQTAATAGATDALAVATRTGNESQLAALRDATATITGALDGAEAGTVARLAELATRLDSLRAEMAEWDDRVTGTRTELSQAAAEIRRGLESALDQLQATVDGGSERLRAALGTEMAGRIDALALDLGGRLDAWRVAQLAAERAEAERAQAIVDGALARQVTATRQELEAVAARLEAAQTTAADADAAAQAALAELVAAARVEQADLLRTLAERGAAGQADWGSLAAHLEEAQRHQSDLIRQESAALAARLDAVLAAQAELARNEAAALTSRLEAAHAGQGELTRAEGAALAARLDAVHEEQAELARQQQGAVVAQLERTGHALVARLAEAADRRDGESTAQLEAAAATLRDLTAAVAGATASDGPLARRLDDLARAQADALAALRTSTEGAAEQAAATRDELASWRAALDARLDHVSSGDTALARQLHDAIEALGPRLEAATRGRLAELADAIGQSVQREVAGVAALRDAIDGLGPSIDAATDGRMGELASGLQQAVHRELAQVTEQLRITARTQAAEAGHSTDAVQQGIEDLRAELARAAARAAADDEASAGERRQLAAAIGAVGERLEALAAGQHRAGEDVAAAVEARLQEHGQAQAAGAAAMNARLLEVAADVAASQATVDRMASLQQDLAGLEAAMQRPAELLSTRVEQLPGLVAAQIGPALADLAERLDPAPHGRTQEAALDRLQAEVARVGELLSGPPADGVGERLDRLAANVQTLRDALVNNEMAGEVGRMATAVLGMERDLGLARQRLADVDRALEAMGDRGDLATVVASLSERLDLGLADLTRTVAALTRTVDGLNRQPARRQPG